MNKYILNEYCLLCVGMCTAAYMNTYVIITHTGTSCLITEHDGAKKNMFKLENKRVLAV